MNEQALSLYDSKDDLRTDAQAWAAEAASLKVEDAESCLKAGTLLKSIKLLRSQVQAWFSPHVDAAMETKRKAEEARKKLTDERDKMERPLVEAESILKRALLMFEAKEEERRLDEEHRIQAEAQARAEQLTREAAERMAAEGLRTGDVGLVEEAQSLFEQPTEAPVVHVASTVPKMPGVTMRDNWKAHPNLDLVKLCAAIGRGEVPVTFVQPNWTAINQFGRSTQGTEPVAGIKWYNDRHVMARG